MTVAPPEPVVAALAAHVERPLGSTGLRRVTVEVLSDGVPRAGYDVAHAWRVARDTCSSVFAVISGSRLRGTSVLLVERRYEPWPLVRLYLPTGSAVREIEPARVEEPLLGTDFTYDDLRFWTPRYLTAATRVERRGDAVVLDGAWEYARGVPVEATARMRVADGLPERVEWRRDGEQHPFRVLTLTGITAYDGVAQPGLMMLSRPGEGYASRMTLRAVAIGVPLPPALFESESLPTACSELRALVPAVLGEVE